MTDVGEVTVIERTDTSPFECPNCGQPIRSPYGGHTWTCHEAYGGCGAQYRFVDAIRRVK